MGAAIEKRIRPNLLVAFFAAAFSMTWFFRMLGLAEGDDLSREQGVAS